MIEKWGTKGGRWYIARETTMPQMQKVHHLILSEDPEFIKEVQKIANAAKRNKVQRENLQKACQLSEETVKKIFAPKEDKYDEKYRELRKRFYTFVQNNDPKFAQFGEYYDYDHKDRDDPDFCEHQAEVHHEIVQALTGEAEWLQEFRDKEIERMQKLRENAMKRWEKNRTAAVEALNNYPRDIAPDTLLSYADRQLDFSKGRLPKLITTEAPSTNKFTSTLSEEAELFKKFAHALNNDVPWVQNIPEPARLVDVLAGEKEIDDAEEDMDRLLSQCSLQYLFTHIISRIDEIPVVDPDKMEESRQDILNSLGSLMCGDIDIQLWMLADIGIWLSQIKSEKSDE